VGKSGVIADLNSLLDNKGGIREKPHQFERVLYPFAAIVGQEQMKLSLLLNAVCPDLGGVLIRGEKGTAKSTAARALTDLLPPVLSGSGDEVQAPFVDLPLGATEDRVIGAIDFERALLEGKPALQPGILAKVHRGILYVDEVNLLDDHLVDSILDVAESGVNLIEREGLSASHESRFVLIGTMNPEEGDLRPQLLDRFALAVEISGEREPAIRKQLLLLRESFDTDGPAFRTKHAAITEQLRKKIKAARKRLPEVVVPKHLLHFIAEICSRNHVAGHRADLVIKKAARALAVWNGRTEVQAEDITTVAPMALLHRMRNSEMPDMPPPPPPENDSDDESQEETESDSQENSPPPESQSPEESGQNNPSESENQTEDHQDEELSDIMPPLPPPSNDAEEDIQQSGDPFKVRRFYQDDLRNLRSGSGRRNRTRSATRQGRYIKSSFRIKNNDLALDATIRAAAPFQMIRRERLGNHMAVHIDSTDKRGKIREKRIGSFLLFVVDASGSMGAQKRMGETKAAILSLLLDAYQKRDRVALVSFRGRESHLLLPPTSSVEMAARLLEEMPVGGRTPLAAGLVEAEKVLTRALRKEPAVMPMVIILTDGRANAGLGTQHRPFDEAMMVSGQLRERFPQARFIVVDTEPQSLIRLGLSERIASALEAEYFKTSDLRAEQLIELAKQ
jgi:magnesium chelatase subunit D